MVIVEEERNGIDIDNVSYRNVEDYSPKVVFIDEECGNLIVVNDGEEFTEYMNQKKKSDVLQ